MDSGPYPYGRRRVFAWSQPEGRVNVAYYEWNSKNGDVPEGFVGIESIEMRGAGMVMFRRWTAETKELLIDVHTLPFTDVGFLECWRPDQDEPWRTLLRFDETGDVSWIDWDAALNEPAPLKQLIRGKFAASEDAPPPAWYKEHRYGFYANFTDRAGTLAWRKGEHEKTLWESLVLGTTIDLE